MADAPAEVETTAVVETPDQTPEVSETPQAPEATPAPEPTPAEPDRGDPRVAFQEERRKRQDLEARLNDSNFIYERARALGLAQEETPSPAPQQPVPQAQGQGIPDVGAIVAHQLDFRETIKAHPQLDPEKGDKGLVAWAAALVDRGHLPSEAADIIFKTIDSQAKKSAGTQVQATLDARAESEALKLSADAITSTAPATTGNEDDESLNARARNWKDPQAQEAAILEKLKRRG